MVALKWLLAGLALLIGTTIPGRAPATASIGTLFPLSLAVDSHGHLIGDVASPSRVPLAGYALLLDRSVTQQKGEVILRKGQAVVLKKTLDGTGSEGPLWIPLDRLLIAPHRHLTLEIRGTPTDATPQPSAALIAPGAAQGSPARTDPAFARDVRILVMICLAALFVAWRSRPGHP